MTTQTAHFSRYTKDMDSHIVVSDIKNFEHVTFQALVNKNIINQLFQKRNGRNGKQYRIIDLFNENRDIIYALLYGGTVLVFDSNFIVNFELTKVNVKSLAWIFPKGMPQNERQMNSWISYVGWVAYHRFV